MLLILLTWLYCGFAFVTLGFAFDRIFGLKSNDFILQAVFGMFTTTMLASIWAIFGRINIEFHIFFTALLLAIIIKYQQSLFQFYRDIVRQITSIPKKFKWFLGMTLLLLLLQSASGSLVIDNETYYVQTIKWLNEYGFVKGLANLHLFFGQTSGWHILQSAFTFSFISDRFNDLNGFFLLLGNLFAVLKFKDYINGKQSLSWMVFLPLTNLFLLPLIAAPSPDLAVCIAAVLLFYYFVKSFEESNPESFTAVFILSVFIVYIKITVLPILLLPLLMVLFNATRFPLRPLLNMFFGGLVLGMFAIKNTILTGNPLFPAVLCHDVLQVDYALPEVYYNFSFNAAKCYDFFITKADFNRLQGWQIFMKWITHSAINGLFVVLTLAVPFVLRHLRNRKPYWILYAVMWVDVAFLISTSPQIRFILPFALLFALTFLAAFFQNKKTINTILNLSLVIVFLLILFPLKPGQQQGKITFQKTQLKMHQLIIPHSNSNLQATYQSAYIGNLKYQSPDSSNYIWVSGNGNLPCVNAKQIEYFRKKLGFIPQQRTTFLKDGFYSKPVTYP